MGGRKSDVALASSSTAEPRRSTRKRKLVEKDDGANVFNDPPLKKQAGKRRLVESYGQPKALNSRVTKKQPAFVDLTGDDETDVSKPETRVQEKPKKSKGKGKTPAGPAEEKRLVR